MEKPLVTLIIFAYKAEKFVAETIEGALNQTYENLEIIISDDASSDNTSKVIKDVVGNYNGNKCVIVNTNEQNMGIVPHMRKLFSMASGEIIATNPGDDISTPNRISDTVDYFNNDINLQMVTFSRINIDENSNKLGNKGVNDDKIYRLDKEYVLSPSFMVGGTAVAFRKNLLSVFGNLNLDAQTEDSTTRFRALLTGSILYSKKIGLKYRIHGNNISIGLGQYKLKSELIAKQYLNDIICAEEKCLITKKQAEILRLKTNFYVSKRKIDELIERKSNTYIIKYAYILKRSILNRIYKYRLSRLIKFI